MDTRHLEAFLQVAAHRSFGKAARALFITQPTITGRIQALESEVGQVLFDRKGNARLTEAGASFLPFAERALNILKEGMRTANEAEGASWGRLHVGASVSISTYVLPGILKDFHSLHPGVEVAVTTGDSPQVLELILSDAVELGLAGVLRHPKVEVEPLYTDELLLVTHPAHPFASSGPVSIVEAGRDPNILYSKGSSSYDLINSAYREAGVVPNVLMYLDNMEACKKMVLEGLGISFLPKHSVEQELKAKTLVQGYLKEKIKMERQCAVLFPKGRKKRKVVEAFFDLLHHKFGFHQVV